MDAPDDDATGMGGAAISLNNLALIYEKMGRWEEAEPTYKRGAHRRTPGADAGTPHR